MRSSPRRVLSVLLRGAAVASAAAQLARARHRTVALASPADASAAVPTPAPEHGITVVVPARNEVLRIGPLLAALADAPGVAEVIVVDDQSNDGTAALAGTYGARVISGQPKPNTWAGKAWALQQGVDAASTQWIVTLDADTRPDPWLPVALVARMVADGADLATVAGSFECPTTGSAWLHPAMLTTLVYRFGPPSDRRPSVGDADRLLANGQCMAFRRERVAIADVADQIVEDVALARSVAAAGGDVRMYDGAALLTTRMYESFVDTWRGWGRSLALPGVEWRPRQLAGAAVVLLAQALPLPRLLLRRGDVVDVVALMLRVGTLAGTAAAYDSPRARRQAAYWLSPCADLPAAAALLFNVARPHQPWRGRPTDA
jgi:dolichol-phosphate mannosyltransferase